MCIYALMSLWSSRKEAMMCDNRQLQKKTVTLSPISSMQRQMNAEILDKLNQLRNLLKEHDSKCWEIGDICVDLMDKHRLSLKDIALATNYTKARISHLHLTARTYPPSKREGYTFEDSLTARQIWLRLPRLNMSPIAIRRKVAKMKNKRPSQVKGYFVQILMKKEMSQ